MNTWESDADGAAGLHEYLSQL